MSNINLFLIVTYLLNNISCIPTNEHDHWSGSKQLDNNYLIKWKTNEITKVLTIKVEAKTRGWVAFGLSSHGLVSESDLVIGWVTDGGQTIFNDFWIDKYETLSVDGSQDWFLRFSSENETHTTHEFYRKYKTCDALADLEVYENTIEESNIIWAYSDQDPYSIETINLNQSNKGFDHVNFFEQEPILQNESDIQVIDYWIRNLSLPSKGKQMLRQFIKPNLTQKIQIIKHQPVFVPSYLNINHHATLRLCPSNINVNLINNNLGKLFPCASKDSLVIESLKCTHMSIITSILSSQALSMPDNAGSTIDPNKTSYVFMLAHFENHENESIEFSFSIRTWTTSILREYEAYVIGIGTPSGLDSDNFGFIAPPKQPLFTISTLTSTYCYDDFLDNNEVYMFALLFHSHHALYHELSHYRNDVLFNVFRYNNYDSRHQPWRSLDSPIRILKGDKFGITCKLQSMTTNNSYTSPTEHCIVSLSFYSKLPKPLFQVIFWSRIPYKTMLEITGLTQIDGYEINHLDDIVIRSPQLLNNTKLIDFIAQNKYKMKAKKLEEFLLKTDQTECCHLLYDQDNNAQKQCQRIKKLPGYYQSIMNSPKQNYCPNNKVYENLLKPKALGSKDNKFRITFRALINSFKLSFDLNN